MNAGAVASAALEYLRRRWSVIPIHPADKRPRVRWQEYQYRPANETTLKDWFQRWPDANVAVVTGLVSGVIVLDIDVAHGGDSSLAELERRHGTLPASIEAITGGGGRHVYFAHPGGVVHNRVALAPGVDLRGDGGYVVAPPSLHASGRRYAWRAGHEPDRSTLATMPTWLLQMTTAEGTHTGHPLAYWRRLVREGVPAGERNNRIASLAGHLLWHGVDPDVTLELLMCWNALRCRPPLPEEEVVRTVESITRLHRRQSDDRLPAQDRDDAQVE
jgi:hypothetical protein